MATRRASAAAGGKRARRPPVARLASKRSARLLGALAEPERLRIIQSLESGPPRSVGEISRALGSPLANVSHHLQHLRRAGLVRRKRRGRHILYSLAPALFRPPEGGAPAVLDLGPCRVHLAGGDTAWDPIASADGPPKSRGPGRGRRGAATAGHDDLQHAPRIEGAWTGRWEPTSAANASTARGKGRKEIVCVVQSRGGSWQATFEGESGHPYRYAVEMEGRLVGGAVLFKGSTDLGEENGGVFDLLGRATDDQFVGYYSSAHYTGVFSLRRVKKG
jgi:DNA-binding transcriptional ArsR family regulator